MKTYNTRLAGIVFAAIVGLDAVVYFLPALIPVNWFAAPLVVLNAPGIPVFHHFADLVRAGQLRDGCLILGCVLFSAVVWSLVSGMMFRRKLAV